MRSLICEGLCVAPPERSAGRSAKPKAITESFQPNLAERVTKGLNRGNIISPRSAMVCDLAEM
jgi:hypothetical protein